MLKPHAKPLRLRRGATIKELVNDELAITLPEGFVAMSAEELEKAYAKKLPDIKGFRDEDKHIIVTITCNKSSGLATKLTNA